MKRILLSLIILFPFLSHAQDSISRFQLLAYPYMNADVGVSYCLMGQYRINKALFFNAAMKYHQNVQVQPKYDNEKLHHRFYAKGIQHIGASLGLKYDFFRKSAFAKPYVFYDLSFFRMDTRTLYLLDDTQDNTGVPVPLVWYKYKNLVSLENAIGLGVAAPIFKNLYLNVRCGVGGNFIFGLPKSDYPTGMHINPSLQYATGLQFNF